MEEVLDQEDSFASVESGVKINEYDLNPSEKSFRFCVTKLNQEKPDKFKYTLKANVPLPHVTDIKGSKLLYCNFPSFCGARAFFYPNGSPMASFP